VTAHRILLVGACLALWACNGSSTSPASTPSPSTTATAAASSTSIVLHETPDNLGCDSIAIDYKTVTFHIDPAAAEQVSAMTDTGVSLVTYWPVGFTAGEGVVRDAAGAAVATDGEVYQGPQSLHGYYVCGGPATFHVSARQPG
jgi:hypothetical protein